MDAGNEYPRRWTFFVHQLRDTLLASVGHHALNRNSKLKLAGLLGYATTTLSSPRTDLQFWRSRIPEARSRQLQMQIRSLTYNLCRPGTSVRMKLCLPAKQRTSSNFWKPRRCSWSRCIEMKMHQWEHFPEPATLDSIAKHRNVGLSS